MKGWVLRQTDALALSLGKFMDKTSLEQRLSLMQRRISETETRINRKIAMIGALVQNGLATQVEANLLKEYVRAHALQVSERDRLHRQLNLVGYE